MKIQNILLLLVIILSIINFSGFFFVLNRFAGVKNERQNHRIEKNSFVNNSKQLRFSLRLQDKEKFIFNIHGPISFLFCFVVLAVCGNRHYVLKTDRRSLVF